MKTITVGICEDNLADSNLLLDYIKRCAFDLKLDIHTHTFRSGKEFLDLYSPDFDIVFLDVQLSDIHGDTVAAKLRQMDSHLFLVFVSKHIGYMPIGYKHEAHNYLLKPVKYESIRSEIKHFLEKAPQFQRQYIRLNEKQNLQKIVLSKLRFVETEDRAIILHYGEDIIHYSCGINSFMKELPEYCFFRSNHSYIVNLRYVNYIAPDINRYSIHLTTGEIIPLSRDRKKDFLLALQKAGEYSC